MSNREPRLYIFPNLRCSDELARLHEGIAASFQGVDSFIRSG